MKMKTLRVRQLSERIDIFLFEQLDKKLILRELRFPSAALKKVYFQDESALSYRVKSCHVTDLNFRV